MDALAAAFERRYPQLPPFTESVKSGIRAVVDSAPPMSERQRRRIGRWLGASPYWDRVGNVVATAPDGEDEERQESPGDEDEAAEEDEQSPPDDGG
jgi:hypothetical protein